MPLPPGVEVLLAPNPSLYTDTGTNTYVVTNGPASVVIDPGPDDAGHLERVALSATAHGRRPQAILITHGHPDHVAGAASLRTVLGAPVLAESLRGSPVADQTLADGAVLHVGEVTLRALHTPGHRFDHLCFLLEEHGALFAGDLVAGRGTVVLAPPEGDLSEYLASLRRLLTLPLRQLLPGHGPASEEPQQLLERYIAHRLEREAQILHLLAAGPATVESLVATIYRDVDQRLHALARLSVLAHLLKLAREGRAASTADAGTETWALLPPGGTQ